MSRLLTHIAATAVQAFVELKYKAPGTAPLLLVLAGETVYAKVCQDLGLESDEKPSLTWTPADNGNPETIDVIPAGAHVIPTNAWVVAQRTGYTGLDTVWEPRSNG